MWKGNGMSNHKLYYGEIAARISCQLYGLCSTNLKLQCGPDETMEDTICSISADAARVFDSLEDLSGEHYIDWNKALNQYSKSIREYLLMGNVPTMADLILMAANSLNQCRAEQLSKMKKL